MTPDARNMVAWLRSAYDKLALAVVLFALLLSVVLLGVFVGHENRELAAAGLGSLPQEAPGRSRAADLNALYDAIENLADPFQLARAGRLLTAETRVACLKCNRPIPAGAEVCPYRGCGAAQQLAEVQDKPEDSDGDLMPDPWEDQFSLDPGADDARQDADGDGWDNLEEFRAGTDPRNPALHPDPVGKLRWIKTQWTILPFSFQSILHPAPGDNVFVLKNRRQARDYYVRVGDTVDGGYKVEAFEPKTREVVRPSLGSQPIVEDVSVLKLSKDGKLIALTLGQEAQPGDLAAELIFLVDQTRYSVKTGSGVTLKNVPYKVVDIQKEAVVVSNTLSGGITRLTKFSEAQRALGPSGQAAGGQPGGH